MASLNEVVLCCTEKNSEGGNEELKSKKCNQSPGQRWYQLAATLNVWHSQLGASFNFIFLPEITTFVAGVKELDGKIRKQFKKKINQKNPNNNQTPQTS